MGVCHHDSFNLGLMFKDGLLPSMPSCCNSYKTCFCESVIICSNRNGGMVGFSEALTQQLPLFYLLEI